MTTRFDAALAPREVDGPVRIRRLPTIGSGGVKLAGNGLASFLYALRRGRRYRVLHAHLPVGVLAGRDLGRIAAGLRHLGEGVQHRPRRMRAEGAGVGGGPARVAPLPARRHVRGPEPGRRHRAPRQWRAAAQGRLHPEPDRHGPGRRGQQTDAAPGAGPARTTDLPVRRPSDCGEGTGRPDAGLACGAGAARRGAGGGGRRSGPGRARSMGAGAGAAGLGARARLAGGPGPLLSRGGPAGLPLPALRDSRTCSPRQWRTVCRS